MYTNYTNCGMNKMYFDHFPTLLPSHILPPLSIVSLWNRPRQLPTDTLVNKVWYIHNGVLFRHKEDRKHASITKMNRTREYTEREKPDPKG